jgi:hypothetical protein
MGQRGLAIIVLAGLGTFLYQLAPLLMKIQDWSILWSPPSVGEILLAIVAGMGAVAAALGLDIPALIQGFKKPPSA